MENTFRKYSTNSDIGFRVSDVVSYCVYSAKADERRKIFRDEAK